jgi:hypothetical protein
MELPAVGDPKPKTDVGGYPGADDADTTGKQDAE